MATILLAAGATALAAGLTPTLIGFGTAGIAAGSIAAGIQAGIGNVVAGSAFATMTSLGMQGVFAGLTGGGALSTIGAAILALL